MQAREQKTREAKVGTAARGKEETSSRDSEHGRVTVLGKVLGVGVGKGGKR
jgi:hypothetical protein